MNSNEFICPRCRGTLKKTSESELYCTTDGLTFRHKDGIWRFLLPERETHYTRFISDYEAVRRFEERGSPNPAFYRALPFHDLSGKFQADWRIRARSYIELERLIMQRLFHYRHPIRIVDMGAGNGWLSNRLALHGLQVSAVDLLVNSEDGLGAWKHYESVFTRIQAEFTRLPFFNE